MESLHNIENVDYFQNVFCAFVDNNARGQDSSDFTISNNFQHFGPEFEFRLKVG